MRQKHCALAALYVCALLGWNQLCATLSQTSDLVAKPPTAAQPDAFLRRYYPSFVSQRRTPVTRAARVRARGCPRQVGRGRGR